jgi:RNA polymerase sigma-70 factor, ECF subfamily
MDVVVDLTHV